MAFIIAFSFTILISTLLQLSISMLAYDMSYLKRMSPTLKLPNSEKLSYYFIAAYPFALVLGIYVGDIFNLIHFTVKQPTQVSLVLWFCVLHFVLSIFGITVTKYLRKRHKANVTFIVTNSIAGACYLYTSAWALVELIKH